MNRKVLIIKNDSNDFEKYYNDMISLNGYHVLPTNLFDEEKTGGLKQKIKRFWKLFFIDKNIVSGYDMIIIFEDGGMIPFLKMKVGRNTKIVLWQWNTKSSLRAKKQEKLKKICEIWTFDSNDAKEYNWKLNNQFYCPFLGCTNTLVKEVKSAFCACVDKGRYPILKEIYELLEIRGVKCDFTLVKEFGHKYEAEPWLKESGISYNEFLKRTLESECSVDIVQHGQAGITVRVLEALFYSKKLITNNLNVKNYPFYSSENIFIYGVDDERILDKFLKTPYKEIKDEIKERYTLDSWIKNFELKQE